MTFTATTYQNEYLPIRGTRADAIVTVVAHGSGAGPVADRPAAVLLILDNSGSMSPQRTANALKRAAFAAIAQIRDGVHFGIIAGSHVATMIYPFSLGLVPASPETRAQASAVVGDITAHGGTAIGQWLLEAHRRLAPYEGSIRHAILLTDGRNKNETPEEFADVLRVCEGVFQCDCRGVGTDWDVDDLRRIASVLLGSVDILPKPEHMATDFEAMMRSAMAKRTADVRLRLWTPQGATLGFVKQVSPTIEDLTPRAFAVDDRSIEFPTGAWGDESRDYHVSISVPAQEVGAEMLAGRVSLVVDGMPVSQSLVRAIWTDDFATSTRIDPQVAHYTGQAELASAICTGLDARSAGDEATATTRFGRAVQIAAASGNDATMQLLARVVDVVDATTGTVRLRREVGAADEMALDTRSTRTVRVRNDE